ncbi:glycosyltransferase [Parafrankia sp. CH37]|uniref:glycosyltransferase n=1 Tax=Parafrankia sp. CH37 TaxID=683308 RepID=UPI001D01E749|nr:glycosyltransferase [Parafrankia sp. CH37]
MRIAMLGTRGVPANYGGFETAVEEVGRRLVELGHDVTVYCRGKGPDEFLGMRRVELPALRRRSLETISHTTVSVAHALRHRPDVALLFNAANAPSYPCSGCGKSRWPCTSTGWSGAAANGPAPGGATT